MNSMNKARDWLTPFTTCPDLLCRWKDMNESYVLADLEAYEARYCGGGHPFSEIIKHGPDPDWQFIWEARDESTHVEDA